MYQIRNAIFIKKQSNILENIQNDKLLIYITFAKKYINI